MSPDKRVFAQSVEALFVRALGPHLSREGRLRLRREGLHLGETLRPCYPLEQWRGFLRVAASDVFPTLGLEGAYFGLGERYHQGLRQTAAGRASLALVTKLGPRRTLERMPHHVRAGNNFNEVRLEEVRAARATLWMKDVTADSPFFACGFLCETLRTAGAEDVSVEPVAFDGTSATFRLAWGLARVARATAG